MRQLPVLLKPGSTCVLVLLGLLARPLAAADEWVEGLPPLPTPRQEVGVAVEGGIVHVIGGILGDRSATGLVDRFDTAAGTWSAAPSLPEGIRIHHVGAAALDGVVYCVGGLDSGFRGVDGVLTLELGGSAWTRRASLPRARGAMGVAALAGRIYAAGGQSGAASFRDFTVYIPGEDRWEDLPPMPTARNHLAAAAHGGLFYAVGGRDQGLLGAFEVYDPGAGAWSALLSLPTPRGGIAAAVLEDEIFVFGGEGNRSSPVGIFSETESYSIERGEWSARVPMAHPRHGIGAAAVDELGRVFIPGGSPVEGFGVTDIHDAFVPDGSGSAVFLRGDSNSDGGVDVSDPIHTLLRLFRDPGGISCEDAADADDSGNLDITDAVFTLLHLFTGGPPPPPPGPFTPGPDPTPDALTCSM
ncbi:MAG TPA: hypothetical protein VMT52_15400 [Planctomycetota bacterium]|nr:hypothetical protein [Planctomycetota bacterium]